VPILAGERLLASLTIRFSSTAVPEMEAIQRFIPRLRATAQRIGQDFLSQSEQQALSIATDTLPPASGGH
jgi:ABC-type branched-subunit amino acid transport system ATPase component